jgi:hypothetical protein
MGRIVASGNTGARHSNAAGLKATELVLCDNAATMSGRRHGYVFKQMQSQVPYCYTIQNVHTIPPQTIKQITNK